MTSSGERWDLARSLFDAARALPVTRRAAFLDSACPDAKMRTEIDELLAAHTALASGREAGFLNRLDAGRAAALLASSEAAPPDAEELSPGDVLGRHRIVRRLGRGGMGVVYLAHDTRLDRPAALKLLRRHLSLDETARRRFEEEARAASALDHPNITTVYDIGEAPDGRLFIAMAYHEGKTLLESLDQGPLPVARVLELGGQIADGLAAAHRGGIVHRDVKPANVVVTKSGIAKLVDFGIAKMAAGAASHTGAMPGTVAYMSPEQADGGAVDARTDLWSLGVVLYEMLTGRRPFRGDDRETVLSAIRHDEPEPLQRPDLPAGIERVVRRCLAKDPEARYRTADELRSELVSLRDRAGVRSRRSTRTVAAAAAAGVIVATATWVTRAGRGPDALGGPAGVIAVMPAVPVSEDSALARVGRELAVTLSASLDGIGGIRTVPALTVLAQVGERGRSLEEGARMARGLGAASVLHGTVLRNGPLVRLDLGLFALEGLESVARASVTASPDDIVALTDSATIMLLRGVWRRDEAPVPGIAAVTTGSLPALRAYVEGELAFARADFDEAVPAFERSFAADSTFALAYWRSLYPRVYEGSRPDSTLLAGILANRDGLPDPERLMAEVYLAPTMSEKLSLLQTATRRFPDYWPGWYDYANRLVHDGPYVGTTYADARVALERVVALNPDFASAWVHLHWMAAQMRDTVAVNRTMDALEEFAVPGSFLVTEENLAYGYAFQELFRTGSLTPEMTGRLAGGTLRSTRVPPENLALRLLIYGFPRANLQVTDAVLREHPPARVVAAQWMGKTFSWAIRGAWDSAFVAAGHWVRLSDDPGTALRAYGLATLGVTLGALEPGTALRWRPDPESTSVRSAEGVAELEWLDGVLAHARGDAASVARSQRTVLGSGSEHADLLAASLEAFRRHATGDRAAAARSLAALEGDLAERYHPLGASEDHPYLSAVHRPVAARWLVEHGDTLPALVFLRWHEAIIGGRRAGAANRVAEPLALYERARLEEALGRAEDAREHYRRFLERYDLPPAQHGALVDSARAAERRLARLAR